MSQDCVHVGGPPCCCAASARSLRRDTNTSKGCGFVVYSNRESANNAIMALNGKFEMTGCKAPMIVQYSDTRTYPLRVLLR